MLAQGKKKKKIFNKMIEKLQMQAESKLSDDQKHRMKNQFLY